MVRFTSLRSTPGRRRVTRSTEALHAAQCIPEMSYFSSRMVRSFPRRPRRVSGSARYPWGVFSLRERIYTPGGYFVKRENRSIWTDFWETPGSARSRAPIPAKIVTEL